MVAPSAQPNAAESAETEGRRCIRCDYLLIGLPEDGACPECGTAIARSAAPVDLLRHQNPAWLGRLAEGLLLQIVANAGFLALSLLDHFTTWRQAHDAAEGHFPLPTVVHIVCVALNLFAAWRVTSPEPGRVEPAWSLRRTVRVLTCLIPLIALGMAQAPYPMPLHWAVAGLGAALIGLADVTLWYAYVRQLALRLPSPSLAFQSLLLLVGCGITVFFTVVMPYAGLTLLAMGVDIGDVYSFGTQSQMYVWAGLLTYACYFCFRLRREILAARPPSDPVADEPGVTD
jgi:hypothetical protein